MYGINKSNFFVASHAMFEQVYQVPDRPADYISLAPNGKPSSEYWWEGGWLIRRSNHWFQVASCWWPIVTDQKIDFEPSRHGKALIAKRKGREQVLVGRCKFVRMNWTPKNQLPKNPDKLIDQFCKKAGLHYLEQQIKAVYL